MFVTHDPTTKFQRGGGSQHPPLNEDKITAIPFFETPLKPFYG